MGERFLIITTIGFALGVVLSIGLVCIKRPGHSVRLLGLYTFTISLGLAEPLVKFFFPQSELFLNTWGAFSFLYGPLLFLYVRTRLSKVNRFNSFDIVHLIPFFSYLILFFASFNNPNLPANISSIDLILYELLFLQIFVYCFVAFKIIIKKRNSNNSEVDKIRLAFLLSLVTLSFILFFGSFCGSHALLIFKLDIKPMFQLSVQLGLSALIFLVALLNTENMHLEKFSS